MVVEDFPDGFPRVARFLDSDDSFGVYRRFGTVFSRLLLNKQDEVSKLEAELMAMDGMDNADDNGKRYLMSREMDVKRQAFPAVWGESRPQLLGKLEEKISEYSESFRRASLFLTH